MKQDTASDRLLRELMNLGAINPGFENDVFIRLQQSYAIGFDMHQGRKGSQGI
jgi:hypothetical protein